MFFCCFITIQPNGFRSSQSAKACTVPKISYSVPSADASGCSARSGYRLCLLAVPTGLAKPRVSMWAMRCVALR